MGEAFVGLGLVFFLFALVLFVLWVLLPFAVFGMKQLMRDAIKHQERTNALLQALIDNRREAGASQTRARD